MKDKIKRFLIDKKELLIFIAVVVVVFATVVTIASLALADTPVVKNDDIVDKDDDGNGNDNPIIVPEDPIKFIVPVSGEYELVRTYFDPTLPDAELVSAIISTGSYMIESKGISYAKKDNSVFDVCSIYDGTVTSVVEDEIYGTCVTIKHSDSVVSVYSSLSGVTLKANDSVTSGQTIGQAATSLFDVEAGVHVHLEIKVNGEFVNPTTIFGKEMQEIEVGK